MSSKIPLILLATLYFFVRKLRNTSLFSSSFLPLTLFITFLIVPILLLLVSGYWLMAAIYILLLVPCHKQLLKIIHQLKHRFDPPDHEHCYQLFDFQPDIYRLGSNLIEVQFFPKEKNIVGTAKCGVHKGKQISALSVTEQQQWIEELKDKHPLSCSLILLCCSAEVSLQSSGELPAPDLYAACTLLGVRSESGRDAINHNFRRLIMGFHPDRGGSDDLAAVIYAAKQVLIDALP